MAYSVQAANRVFEYITGKIRAQEWPAGTRIATEAQLCEQLGVSRIAVRQAIEKLSALSVLRKVQGSGTYVEEFEKASLMGLPYYPVTKDTMIAVLEFRRMFDSYNTEFFIEKCSEEDVQVLEENYQSMKDAEKDKRLFRTLDHAFHNYIAKGTKNPIITQISELLTDMLTEHQVLLYDNVGPEHSIYYHGIILGCARERNPELGGLYAKMHIDNSLQRLSLKSDEELLRDK